MKNSNFNHRTATRTRWGHGIAIAGGYLIAFHAMTQWPDLSLALGSTTGLLLVAVLCHGFFAGYFANRWDFLFHSAAVTDIFLEAFLIPEQAGLGFYACFAAFAVVISSYHQWCAIRSPHLN